MIKRILKKFFLLIGLEVSRKKTSDYEYLLEYQRYKEINVKLLGANFKIIDSLSFYWSFKEIFEDGIYSFDSDKRAPFILDCGSNCGASVVFFKSKYPESRIIAVEADPRIFDILKCNINDRNYNNVTLINKAVSSREREVAFSPEGADGGRICNINNYDECIIVESVKLDELIVDDVDFLKLDIEGEETDVISTCQNLNKVSNIFIEYHSFFDKEQSLEKILSKLHDEGFRYFIHTQFCSRMPLVKRKVHCGMDLKLNVFAKKIAV
jgi:FkbM family methyltransferase